MVQIRSKPVVTGRENMLGKKGHCVSDEEGETWVYVNSETWKARASIPLSLGETVKVIGVKGLVLEVQPVDSTQEVFHQTKKNNFLKTKKFR